MQVWWWIFLCGGGKAAVKRYQFHERATAIFEHVDRPFTQGLAVQESGECASTGDELDQCVRKSQKGWLVDCYVKTLQRCIVMYESSGLYGQSFVQKVRDFAHGTPAYRAALAPRLFAEGMDMLGNGSLAVGTWKERRMLMYWDDGTALKLSEELYVQQPSEHWGMASNNGTKMWMTSGSSVLYEFDLPLKKVPSMATGLTDAFRNKRIESVKADRTLRLTCEDKQIPYVNELAWDGETDTLWGNVWMSDKVYQFNHSTGNCVGVLSLHSDKRLAAEQRKNRDVDAVWNGIAFLGKGWIIFTGKRFQHYYLSKLIPAI